MEISASFAEENMALNQEQYNAADTEMGKLYIPLELKAVDDKVVLDYWKFLWMEGIRVSGLKALR